MKLILGSDKTFVLKYGYSLTGIPKDKIKLGYINTASLISKDKYFEDIEENIRKEIKSFEKIDILGKSTEQIRSFFRDKNVIQLEGGNTFYLLKVIKETGFDKILNDLLTDGKVFIGTSSGAYVMCPTIEVADWDETGRSRHGVTDFSALNYVPFLIKAHYKVMLESKIKQKMNNLEYPLRILRDGQGFLVEDNKITFIGDEKETIL